MSKLTLGTHPFLLGFDQLERLVERTAKSENGYPPYNIEHVSDNAFRITLAVAGFADDALSITVEDRQLVVRGKRNSDDTSEQDLSASRHRRAAVSAHLSAGRWRRGLRRDVGKRVAAYRPCAIRTRKRGADDPDKQRLKERSW